MSVQELRDLAPAYVLGALDPAEARDFEAALAGSPELQHEVASYRELAALLALRDSAATPAGLRERLLERVRQERSAEPPSSPPVVPLDAGRRQPRWLVVAPWVGLAASLALAAGLGLQVRRLGLSAGVLDSTLAANQARLAARERTLNAILEPGVQLVPLTSSGAQPPGIQLFWDRQRNTAVLHAFRLEPAPEGRAYQLWLIRSGQPVPSQVFNSDPDGHALVEGITIPTEPGIEAYAVTQEPAAGSSQPTLPILLFGRVPTS
jgi:anti-sigma-K factor RskA